MPINAKYTAVYGVLAALNSRSPANTFDINIKVAQLRRTEIRLWDVAIQVFYNRDTVMYALV